MSIDRDALQELERQAKNMLARKNRAAELIKTHQHDGVYFEIVNLNLTSELVKIKSGFPPRIC
jgi:hypothetical protein